MTRNKILTMALCPLLLASVACEEDEHTHDHGADAGALDTDAAAPEPDATATVMPVAYALGSDSASAGTLATVILPSLEVTQNSVAGVAASDSVLRESGGLLYIVNRFGSDNVTIVNPETSQLVAQISTGAGTNPQDVAVIGDSIYVCAFNSGNIIVLDSTAPTATPTTIDISAYDEDGVPNCASIVVANGKLFATLGLLDEAWTSQGGKLIVIDPSDNSITSDLDLAFTNPFGQITVTESGGAFGGDLLISAVGDFAPANGCLERVTTGDTPASSGCLVSNADLGGYAGVVHMRGSEALLAVSTSFTSGELVSVSSDGTVAETPLTPDTQYVSDFAVCPEGELITNDRESGGLRVYGADGSEMTTTALDIGLPSAFSNAIVCL